MKIMIAHNRYRQQGGEDTVVASERAMLIRQGHQVESLIVDNDLIHGAAQWKAAANYFFSIGAYRQTTHMLQQFRPDVLHVHNILPTLSPSVFFAATSARVPVVHTLHNYRLICANAQLFRENAPCEQCPQSRSFLPGVRHACYRGSRTGSAIVGGSTVLHDLLGTWRNRVQIYIALTSFAAQKLSEQRIPMEKIRIKPNFAPDRSIGTGSGGTALFVGRLSPEKGIHTILEADRLRLLPVPVKIAGGGPLLREVQESAARPGSRLVVLGPQSSLEIEQHMREAVVLLSPSVWYEGFPMVIAEAFSFGLPVIASRIGGMPEILGETGKDMLVTPGDPRDLAASMRAFLSSGRAIEFKRSAFRRRYETHFNEARNYESLLQIYEEARGMH